MPRILLPIVLLGLMACASRGAAELPRSGYDTISISVGACYGPCPMYNLVIASNGSVRFQDWGYQGARGPLKTRTLGAEGYEAVADALAAYRPPNALPECLETETDAQDFTIVWTDRSGSSASLHHYGGDVCPASEELTRVLYRIPELSGVSQWLSTPS